LNRLIAFRANGFDNRIRVEGGGDAEHVPGAVGVIGLAVGMDFEVCGNPGERICHADGQGLWLEEEGVAVMEFFVVYACFFGGDVKVLGGDVYTWREGRVREVVVDVVPDLPEEGVVHFSLTLTLSHRERGLGAPNLFSFVFFVPFVVQEVFIPFEIFSARSILITFSATICAAAFSINSPLAPAAMATCLACSDMCPRWMLIILTGMSSRRILVGRGFQKLSCS
jgi:hypothetical protein